MHSNKKRIILKQVKKCKVVSFDFFDTLFFRTVKSPMDVFSIIEKEYNHREDSGFSFLRDRVVAEKRARRNSLSEVSLNEIYSFFPCDYSEKNRSELMQLEKKVEQVLCVPNKEVVEILHEAKCLGKKIIIISDFYIGRSFFEDILFKFDIAVDDIFVSCDLRRSKEKGDLFDYVADCCSVSPKSIFHFGDNIQSDYKNAKSHGISSLHYVPNRRYKETYVGRFAKHVDDTLYYCTSLLRAGAFRLEEKKTKDGYAILGPLLVGFCNWLLLELETEGINKVFFLSRDGHIIMEAFNLLFSDRKNISASYLYASRRAFQVPRLAETRSIDDIFDMEIITGSISVQKYFSKLGFSDEWIVDYCRKEGLDINDIIDRELIHKQKLEAVLYDSISAIINQNSLIEKESIINYLLKRGVVGKCAIVDIGWYGNMQRNLESLLQKKVKIYGYYVGVDPNSKYINSQKMKGYLFDSLHNKDDRSRQAWYNITFELMFSANQGSFLNVKEGVPVFKENENTDNWDYLGSFQNGALAFVNDYKNKKMPCEFLLARDIVFEMVNNYFINPDVDTAREWSNLVFEDFGIRKVNDVKSQLFPYSHPIKFLSGLKHSSWKPGFLVANLGFQIDFSKLYPSSENDYNNALL